MADTPHEVAMKKIDAMFSPPDPGREPTQAPDLPPDEVDGEASPGEGVVAEGTQQEPTEGQPEETSEVEIDGEVYLVPSKIKDRFIHHADYTRKTQDVAEMRRALSAEREATALERAFSEATKEEQKQLVMVEAHLEQFRKVDWSRIEDTSQLIHLRTQLDQLKDTKAELEKSITGRRKEFNEKVQAKAAEAQEAGQKYIETHVKGWGDTVKSDLFSYGMTEGYTRDELDRIVDPRIVVTLWKSRQWDSLQAQRPAVTKRAAQAAPVVRPGNSQPQPSQAAQLNQAIKKASTDTGKRRAMEDYFAARLGGSR